MSSAKAGTATSWQGLYQHWIHEAERHMANRQARIDDLTAEVESEHVIRGPFSMSGTRVAVDHVARGRIASDPIAKSEQVKADRAVALATMYGLGVVAEQVSRLATGRGNVNA